MLCILPRVVNDTPRDNMELVSMVLEKDLQGDDVIIEENNMGNMDAMQAEKFFNNVKDELNLGGFNFGITTAGSICLKDRILIDKRDLNYPWFTKQMILHEIAHHLAPEDKTHGVKFHRKYAELVNKFLAGVNGSDTLINWLIERRRKFKEGSEHHLQSNPRDIQSARIAGIKARALQEVINYLG